MVEVHTVEDNLLDPIADPTFLGVALEAGVHAAVKVLEQQDAAAAFWKLKAATEAAGAEAARRAAGSTKAALEGAKEYDLWSSRLSQLVPATGTYALSTEALTLMGERLQAEPSTALKLVPAVLKVAPPPSAAAGPAGPMGLGLGRLAAPPAAAAAAAAQKQYGYSFGRSLTSLISSVVGAGATGLYTAIPSNEYALIWGEPPFAASPDPNAARDALVLLHTAWAEQAGASFAADDVVVEVSPLVSYGGEGLEPWCGGKTFEESFDVGLQGFVVPQGAKSNMGPRPAAWLLPFGAAYAALAAFKFLSK